MVNRMADTFDKSWFMQMNYLFCFEGFYNFLLFNLLYISSNYNKIIAMIIKIIIKIKILIIKIKIIKINIRVMTCDLTMALNQINGSTLCLPRVQVKIKTVTKSGHPVDGSGRNDTLQFIKDINCQKVNKH